MIEPPSDDDRRRADAQYLHFENEDPRVWDIYFDSFDEAIEYMNAYGWSFATEDWEPFGMFERRIECKDHHGNVVGQLLMLTVKIE
jgi:hypothetical protein